MFQQGLTAVIDLGESSIRLGPNVTHFDARERTVVFKGPNRNDKAVGAIIFAVNDETRLNEGVGTNDA